eukprot:763482-Hanusia_phi.AAC.1
MRKAPVHSLASRVSSSRPFRTTRRAALGDRIACSMTMMTGGRDEIKPLMPFPYLTLAHSPLSLPFSLSVSTLVEGSQWGGGALEARNRTEGERVHQEAD